MLTFISVFSCDDEDIVGDGSTAVWITWLLITGPLPVLVEVREAVAMDGTIVSVFLVEIVDGEETRSSFS